MPRAKRHPRQTGAAPNTEPRAAARMSVECRCSPDDSAAVSIILDRLTGVAGMWVALKCSCATPLMASFAPSLLSDGRKKQGRKGSVGGSNIGENRSSGIDQAPACITGGITRDLICSARHIQAELSRSSSGVEASQACLHQRRQHSRSHQAACRPQIPAKHRAM